MEELSTTNSEEDVKTLTPACSHGHEYSVHDDIGTHPLQWLEIDFCPLIFVLILRKYSDVFRKFALVRAYFSQQSSVARLTRCHHRGENIHCACLERSLSGEVSSVAYFTVRHTTDNCFSREDTYVLDKNCG